MLGGRRAQEKRIVVNDSFSFTEQVATFRSADVGIRNAAFEHAGMSERGGLRHNSAPDIHRECSTCAVPDASAAFLLLSKQPP
ncbi:hypothetical protein Fraau_0566 [Frateuria aurantia DSM 6220]|uniref:Uncharacterized protein n=1 Tax=Frateuria aurantia (strain ATCC 33424 / DSM 6220 / KCTC 2777 / LMG 1558 / NBRC 3245 / NCIMB 13370) TaxID=767434 RepID=H8L591_FRAAD|nr:hypothetical protein Fraau_0566 [Frateuria aurantia DSM 6220]